MNSTGLVWHGVLLAALAVILPGDPVQAQNLDPLDIRACTTIETDSQRLACYDSVTGHDTLPAAERKPVRKKPSTSVFISDAQQQARDSESGQYKSLLDSRWELDPSNKLGTLNVRGYKPVYAMPIFVTSNQNQMPSSPNPDNTEGTPQGLDKHEAKFQISFKTKIWQGVFGETGDIWVGYTQSSRWQVYNSDMSRPFRETNYEPEVMLLFDTSIPLFGWRARMLGIGLDHQSNGRANPLSRSWNRIVGRLGFEREGWTVVVRPWLRIPEARDDDDNADITDYLGHGDMQVVHEWGEHEFTLVARHAFHTHRGAGQFTWAFPVSGGVRGYLELFNGYGESLIDYNHKATYIGLGITLLDWY